jgi:hypothetical protein
MAICSAVSPSSATALGSAPANSSSCDCYGTFKKIYKKEGKKKKEKKSAVTSNHCCLSENLHAYNQVAHKMHKHEQQIDQSLPST